jgi:hypothetical protein
MIRNPLASNTWPSAGEQIAQMFVVDRVEFAVFQHVEQIRGLDFRDPGRLEDVVDPPHEIVEVRDMREHVFREEDIGGLPRTGQPPS